MRATLLGFSDANLDAEIDGFLLKSPNPDSTSVVNFLLMYGKDQRETVGRALIAKGVSASSVSNAMTWLDRADHWNPTTFWGALTLASGAASAYHGYKRNNSIGWAVAWFLMGSIFPIITPTIALAQGFGKRKAA